MPETTTCTNCDNPAEFYLVPARTQPTWCLDCTDALDDHGQEV